MIKVLALMGAILAPSLGAAAVWNIIETDEGSHIEMKYGTSTGDAQRFKTTYAEALQRDDFTHTLTLEGPGGVANEAREMVKFMSNIKIKTVVKNEKTCASACAIIFLAGDERVVGKDAKLGLHFAYYRTADMKTFVDEYGWQGVRERMNKLAVWQVRMYSTLNIKDMDAFYDKIEYTTGMWYLTPQEITDVIGAKNGDQGT